MIYMTDRVFLDTNILVYAYDSHEPARQQQAQSVILEGIRCQNAAVSSQVFGEFFTVVTRKIKQPLTASEAQEVIGDLSILDVIDIDLNLVNRAIDTHRQSQISYWDSLIIAAAERASCESLLSEDMNAGQCYNGVVVINPFQNH